MMQHFNLNPKRNLKSLLRKEPFEYQGTLYENTFTIIQNNSLRNINDGLYFFFTEISGSITRTAELSHIDIKARPNDKIRGMLYLAPILILILILLKSYGSAIFGNAITIGTCIYAKKKIKEDFEIFAQRLNQVISINH